MRALADGLEFEKIVEKFVRNYCDIYYDAQWENIVQDDEAHAFVLSLCKDSRLDSIHLDYEFFIEILRNIIVHSTGIHYLWAH